MDNSIIVQLMVDNGEVDELLQRADFDGLTIVLGAVCDRHRQLFPRVRSTRESRMADRAKVCPVFTRIPPLLQWEGDSEDEDGSEA